MVINKCQDRQRKSFIIIKKVKQIVNISKEDMEDNNWVMLTHAMDFFKDHEEYNLKTFFHKFSE